MEKNKKISSLPFASNHPFSSVFPVYLFCKRGYNHTKTPYILRPYFAFNPYIPPCFCKKSALSIVFFNKKTSPVKYGAHAKNCCFYLGKYIHLPSICISLCLSAQSSLFLLIPSSLRTTRLQSRAQKFRKAFLRCCRNLSCPQAYFLPSTSFPRC